MLLDKKVFSIIVTISQICYVYVTIVRIRIYSNNNPNEDQHRLMLFVISVYVNEF